MAYLLLAITGLAALALFVVLKVQRNRKYRYPPGPPGLPILGNLFQGKVGRPHEFFSTLRKQYGDIVTVQMAGETIIVLNSLEAINECFGSKKTDSVCSGSPLMLRKTIPDNDKAITSMDANETWFKLRKVIHKFIHMYGEGVQNMEDATMAELKHVVNWVANQGGEPFSPEDVIVLSAINNIATLILGKRLDYGEKALKSIIEFNANIIKYVSIGINSLVVTFPFLLRLPFSYGTYYQRSVKALDNLLFYMYEQPKQSYDPSASRGLLDDLLKYQQTEKEALGDCWLDDDLIKMTIKDLLSAGSITTRGALTSFFLIILHKPEVAEKITSEIDEVIGQGDPSLKHISRMPYTEATIWELLRYISHAPLGLTHCTTADVYLRDYFIPAGTSVVPNQWEVLHDEALWDKPWEFRPERFLDKHGNILDVSNRQRRNMIAFGVGKRSCPGETFARSRIFLFITILLQRFNFQPAKGEQLPSADPRDFQEGAVLLPFPYKLQAIHRNF